MSAIDTNLVVLDVVTRWRIDAALTLIASAAFLGWSLHQSGTAHALIAFVVEIVVGVLVERWAGILPGAARLASAAPLPAGARDGSAVRYTVDCAVWILAMCAVVAAVAVALGDASYFDGWLAAFAIVRLAGAARARGIERRDRVRLRVAVGSWRANRSGRYYTTAPVY